MPLTPAYDKLTYHSPVSSLFSFSIIFSMLLQSLNITGFQILIYFLTDLVFPKQDEDFRKNFCGENEEECEDIDNFRKCSIFEEDEDKNCIDNSAIFYISFAQYLILCIVFAKGKPFKKSIFHNLPLFIFSVIIFIYSEYIVFYVDQFSEEMIKIIPFPDDSFYFKDKSIKPKYYIQFKFYVMIIIIINFLVSLFIERIIVAKATKCWNKMKMNSLKKSILSNDKRNEENLYIINKVQNYIKEQKMQNLLE